MPVKSLGILEYFLPELELLELPPVAFGSGPVPWSFSQSREMNLGLICKSSALFLAKSLEPEIH